MIHHYASTHLAPSVLTRVASDFQNFWKESRSRFGRVQFPGYRFGSGYYLKEMERIDRVRIGRRKKCCCIWNQDKLAFLGKKIDNFQFAYPFYRSLPAGKVSHSLYTEADSVYLSSTSFRSIETKSRRGERYLVRCSIKLFQRTIDDLVWRFLCNLENGVCLAN